MTLVGSWRRKYRYKFCSKEEHWKKNRPLGDLQGYWEMAELWKAISEAARGIRPPLKQEVMDQILVSLTRTMHEHPTRKSRIMAARVLMLISSELWNEQAHQFPVNRPARPREVLEFERERKKKGVGRYAG